MAILDVPPKEWKRPAIPLLVKLEVLLRQAAARGIVFTGIAAFQDQVAFYERDLFGEQRRQYDHRPPLSERRFNTMTLDTIPPANDPEHIEAVSTEEHDRRTNGRGGERRVTSYGSDSHSRAKTRRLSAINPNSRLGNPSARASSGRSGRPDSAKT